MLEVLIARSVTQIMTELSDLKHVINFYHLGALANLAEGIPLVDDLKQFSKKDVDNIIQSRLEEIDNRINEWSEKLNESVEVLAESILEKREHKKLIAKQIRRAKLVQSLKISAKWLGIIAGSNLGVYLISLPFR